MVLRRPKWSKIQVMGNKKKKNKPEGTVPKRLISAFVLEKYNFPSSITGAKQIPQHFTLL